MTDIDPNREWFYSITVRTNDGAAPYRLRGVSTQGMCTTREALVNGIVDDHIPWSLVLSIVVHHMERNEL